MSIPRYIAVKVTRIKRRENLSHFILALIWPFIGLIVSLRNYRKGWAKNLFWLFCIYFGFIFVVSTQGADSSKYLTNLINFSNSDFTFSSFVNALYSEGTTYVDVVEPFLTFMISRITTNGHILFGVFGIIFGYFYSRNIWYVLDRFNGKITMVHFLLITAYALLNPIWNINGFRMYAAAHIFLFGALPWLMEGDKKRLIWSFVSVFVHFSFFLPVIILIIYLFAGNRITVYFWFFIFASFISELNLDIVSQYLGYLPGIFKSRVETYLNEDYISSVSGAYINVNWYVPYSQIVIKWIVYFFSCVIFFNGRKILAARKELLSVFCFALLFYGVANIARYLPSGGRFITVASLFMFAFFTWFVSEYWNRRLYAYIKMLSIPLLLLFIIVTIRIGFDYTGIMTIIGNPVASLFYEDKIPMIDYIKQMI